MLANGLLDSLQPGDLVQFPRIIYSHYGVYVGDGDIVHLSGDPNAPKSVNSGPQHSFSIGGKLYGKAKVCREHIKRVSGWETARINNGSDTTWRALSRDDIVGRAVSMIGDAEYNLITRNCEHFANWCRYDRAESKQATIIIIGTALAAIVIATAIYRLWRSEDKEKGKQQQKR